MDSRYKPDIHKSKSGKVTRKYCDKAFKKNLEKALKINNGEPDNIDKIKTNRCLYDYPEKRIIEYVNNLSIDIQKKVEESMKVNQDDKEIFEFARFMSKISGKKKPQELPFVMKLMSESDNIPHDTFTNNVNFKALNRFLYSAVCGLPDTTDLNDETRKVLFDTFEMLKDQIEHDSTPEFMQELKSKISAGFTEESHHKIVELAKITQHTSINPLNFPFEYLLNGILPLENTE
ncbi:CLUMA_CG013545, isoform A [Clunio marinus]|uniref:CLUMA_CG013545, isoform A n=1 Tax=Clunio marinus TaxID=568069 RepID=A0A1J1IJ96_9DIPT|nr:CLUMA_CG013545, isoform A [Clunio marinus]